MPGSVGCEKEFFNYSLCPGKKLLILQKSTLKGIGTNNEVRRIGLICETESITKV